MKTLLFIMMALSGDIYSQMTQYVPYRCNGKWGYAHRSGSVIIAARYDTAMLFNGGFAVVGLNTKYGVINEKDEVILPILFDEIAGYNEENDFIKAREHSIWFYWDTTGSRINIKSIKAASMYDCVQVALSGGLAYLYLHERNGRFGFVHYICDDMDEDSCKILQELKFTNYQEIGPNFLALEDENGWSIFDYCGEIIHPYNLDTVHSAQLGRCGNQFYLIGRNQKYGLMNAEGKIVVEPKYDSIAEQKEAFYSMSKDWYWSAESLFLAKLGTEYFYIDQNGNEYRCSD